jgi:hypothetical protein
VTHRGTGTQFPGNCNGMQRRSVRTIDGNNDHLVVHYERSDRQLWATIYIYPKQFAGTSDPREHFASSMQAVASSYEGVERETAIERPLAVGGRDRPGFVALFRYRERAARVGSMLFLVPIGDRFVKVRTTRVLEAGDESLPETLDAGLGLLALLTTLQ